MKTRWFILFLSVCFVSCTETVWQRQRAFSQVVLSYDDFGPESIASRLLGPRGRDLKIIVHHNSTRLTPSSSDGVRYVNTSQAMDFLRYQVRHLPRTPENEGVRARLRATYSPIYDIYRRRRDAITSVPFPYSRGSVNRAFTLPPRPPTI